MWAGSCTAGKSQKTSQHGQVPEEAKFVGEIQNCLLWCKRRTIKSRHSFNLNWVLSLSPVQIVGDGVCVCLILVSVWPRRSPWLTFYQLFLQHPLVWDMRVQGQKLMLSKLSEILSRAFDDLLYESEMLSFISLHFCVCETCWESCQAMTGVNNFF